MIQNFILFFSFYYYRIFKIYKIIQNQRTLLRIKKSTIEIFSRIQKYNFDSFPTSFSFSFLNNRFNWRDREREREKYRGYVSENERELIVRNYTRILRNGVT